MKPANLEQWNALLDECGCCLMPRCCPPLIEYRMRDAASGCGGHPPLIDGAPGAEKILYKTVTEEEHTRQETNASDSYPGAPGFFSWEGSMSDTYQLDRIVSKNQISPPSLRRDHTFGWVICTGEDILECEGSYHLTYSYTGSSSTDLPTTFSRSIEYEYENQEVGSDCDTVELVDTSSETGSIDRIPDPPSISLPGSPREDDVDTCTRSETTLEKIADHIVINEAYDNYTGHSQYLLERKWTYSEPIGKSELIDFSRARMDDEDNPWFTPSSPFRAVFMVYWPKYPEIEAGSGSESLEPDSGSDPISCELSACETAITDATSLQYRFKLNKCCGYKTIRSEWSEVFFPRAYLEWLALVQAAGSDAGELPANPGGIVVTKKVWVWTGTPPLCDTSDSGSGSDADNPDPYSNEAMWSPWSATMKVPEGQEGIVVLWRYRQLCYGSIPDEMPGVFNDHFNLSDSAIDIP